MNIDVGFSVRLKHPQLWEAAQRQFGDDALVSLFFSRAQGDQPSLEHGLSGGRYHPAAIGTMIRDCRGIDDFDVNQLIELSIGE